MTTIEIIENKLIKNLLKNPGFPIILIITQVKLGKMHPEIGYFLLKAGLITVGFLGLIIYVMGTIKADIGLLFVGFGMLIIPVIAGVAYTRWKCAESGIGINDVRAITTLVRTV